MIMDYPGVTELAPDALFIASKSSPVQPLRIRNLRHKLPCGTVILAVAVEAIRRDQTYSIVAMPGFEGGGRDVDGSMMPRTVSTEYTPKVVNAESKVAEPVWPPLLPVVRLVNGHLYDGWQFPETAMTRRLERAFSAVEPLLRQLCNLQQAKLAKGRRGKAVSTAVLVDRINAILAAAV